MQTLAIGLLGAGRMGRQILAVLAGEPSLQLAGVWVRQGSDLDGEVSAVPGGLRLTTDAHTVAAASAVLVDFSLPAALPVVLDAALTARRPLVCGVSGLSAAALEDLRAAASHIPLFYDRNMSIGIAVLRRLVQQAGRLLGTEFAAEIDDLHHAGKKDAPSGTALLLGETLAASRGSRLRDVMRYPPDIADPGPAAPGDIVFQVTREGSHPGRHSVTLAGPDERLSLTHEVADRRVFAVGALRAARWLVSRPAGLYNMADLLNDPIR